MQFDPLKFVMDLVLSSPFWVKALLTFAIVIRVGWPELFVQKRAFSRQRWYRRRYTYWY